MNLDQIIVGDTLESLKGMPSDFVDVSVTSPPYNKQENKKGWLVKNVQYQSSSDALPEDEYQQQQIAVLNAMYRVTKPGGSFFYNHKIRWERGILLHPYAWISKSDWVVKQEIIWDRMLAANIRGWRFWQVDERVYWLYKPIGKNLIGEELLSKHALMTSIWRISPERNGKHPAAFPLELPLRAIYSILDETKQGIILDPYCGSGTTLVAAKILGHKYLGVEISEDYVDMAQNRLANYGHEVNKAQTEIDKHLVSKSFADRKREGKSTGKFGPGSKTRF